MIGTHNVKKCAHYKLEKGSKTYPVFSSHNTMKSAHNEMENTLNIFTSIHSIMLMQMIGKDQYNEAAKAILTL